MLAESTDIADVELWDTCPGAFLLGWLDSWLLLPTRGRVLNGPSGAWLQHQPEYPPQVHDPSIRPANLSRVPSQTFKPHTTPSNILGFLKRVAATRETPMPDGRRAVGTSTPTSYPSDSRALYPLLATRSARSCKGRLGAGGLDDDLWSFRSNTALNYDRCPDSPVPAVGTGSQMVALVSGRTRHLDRAISPQPPFLGSSITSPYYPCVDTAGSILLATMPSAFHLFTGIVLSTRKPSSSATKSRAHSRQANHTPDSRHLPSTEDMTVIHGFSDFLFGFLTRSTFRGGRRIGLVGMVGGGACDVARRGPQSWSVMLSRGWTLVAEVRFRSRQVMYVADWAREDGVHRKSRGWPSRGPRIEYIRTRKLSVGPCGVFPVADPCLLADLGNASMEGCSLAVTLECQ